MTRPTRWPRRGMATAGTLVLAAALAGCGGGSDSDDGTVSLTLGYYAEAGSQADETMRALAEKFENKHPGISVTLESAEYDNFFKRLRTQLAGGQAPDVWLSDGVLVEEFAGRGSLRDLSGFAEGIDTGGYYGVDINRDSDGHLYGFPQGAQTPVLFYNKDMFAEAGIDAPMADWTYDDLAAAARKLTRDTDGDGKPDVWGMRVYSTGFTESWWPIIKAFGSDIVTDDGRKAVLDSRASGKALTWMRQAMNVKKIGPDVTTTNALGNPHTMFASGQVAMQYGIYARTGPAVDAGIDLGVAPLPQGPGGRGNVAIVNSWVVNQETSQEQAQAAWKWIKYFASEEPQTRWAEIGEAIPINKQVADSDAFLNSETGPKNKQVFLDALEASDDLGLNPVWTEYTTAVTNQIEQALDGSKGIPAAIRDARTEAQRIIDRFYQSE